jgi:hypothetical protein
MHFAGVPKPLGFGLSTGGLETANLVGFGATTDAGNMSVN